MQEVARFQRRIGRVGKRAEIDLAGLVPPPVPERVRYQLSARRIEGEVTGIFPIHGAADPVAPRVGHHRAVVLGPRSRSHRATLHQRVALLAYIDDIFETGPRYVQWNLPLYDDDVLCVIPGSHIRRGTEEENQTIGPYPRAPVRGAVQTQLRAGDGLAYILPILHWGIDYTPKLRRTIHGGFARLTQWDDVSWLKYLSPAAQDTFSRWHQRSATYVDKTEAALRAVLHKNPEAYHAALDALQPGRGDKGVLKSTICLSKTAKYIYNQRCRDFDSLSAFEQRCVHIVQPTTLQWGLPLGERFEGAEARVLWERFKPIDDILQTEEEHTVPGFQGADTPTRYLFEEIPAELSVENWMASWQSGRLGD